MKAEPTKPSLEPRRRESIRSIVVVAIVAVVLGLLTIGLAGSCHRHHTEPELITYEGVVVDKWAVYSHTEQGSFPYYKLLIEKRNGARIRVPVEYNDYQKVRVGMWVKRTGARFEVGIQPASVSSSNR